MNNAVNILDLEYEIEEYKVTEDTIIFNIKSEVNELCCPYCGYKSSRVHSRYRREIQDLPIQNKKVILLVLTRKMFCGNQGCSHKTFSEIHPFVLRKERKTKRLEENILSYSTHLSSVKASKLLKKNGIQIGKSSICEMLKKNPIDCG